MLTVTETTAAACMSSEVSNTNISVFYYDIIGANLVKLDSRLSNTNKFTCIGISID